MLLVRRWRWNSDDNNIARDKEARELEQELGQKLELCQRDTAARALAASRAFSMARVIAKAIAAWEIYDSESFGGDLVK